LVSGADRHGLQHALQRWLDRSRSTRLDGAGRCWAGRNRTSRVAASGSRARASRSIWVGRRATANCRGPVYHVTLTPARAPKHHLQPASRTVNAPRPAFRSGRSGRLQVTLTRAGEPKHHLQPASRTVDAQWPAFRVLSEVGRH
jgi:hypothetical protein